MPAYQDTEEMSHLKTPPTDHYTFVDDESFDSIKETAPRPLYQRQTLLQRWAIPVAIHLTLITFYTVIALAILRLNQSSDAHGPRLIYCIHPMSSFRSCPNPAAKLPLMIESQHPPVQLYALKFKNSM